MLSKVAITVALLPYYIILSTLSTVWYFTSGKASIYA